jgi:asparagine synthase (glutamine-hydrolysing)
VLRAADQPNGMGDMYTSLYLLFRAIRGRSTVALSGESADEVFGGYRWFHDADAVAADTFPWLADMNYSLRADGDNGASLLDTGLNQQLNLPAYREASYRAGLAEVPYLDGVTGLERRMREICYLHLTRFVQILLDRKDRMSMASGLEVRVPFCDHRLVEYVFNTPWSMKTFDGREKSLLRAAAADILPESILQRRKSPYPSTQDPTYEQALRDELAKLLAQENAPVTGLLDVDRARALVDGKIGQTNLDHYRRNIELILQLNTWLEDYDLKLDLTA